MPRVLISGDFCPRCRVADLISANNHLSILQEIKPLIESADLAITNLECPLTDKNLPPIAKAGPNIKGSPRSLEILKDAGFGLVTLANNHIKDYGSTAIEETLLYLGENAINYVGAGKDINEASEVKFFYIKGCTIGVINCCEHEFSIASKNNAGANPINPIQQWYKITEAKRKAQYVIVITHGGVEHLKLPTPRMKELFHFYIDAGADAVINHHQHCYSGYEVYNNKLIFYGLGNFCFDGNRAGGNVSWNEGFMIDLDFSENSFHFVLVPYIQCKETPDVKLMKGEKKKDFFCKIDELNQIIMNDDMLENAVTDFYNHLLYSYESLLTPYSSRYFNALCKRKLIPSFVKKSKVIRTLNIINCESHRDLFEYSLNHLIRHFKQ